MNYQSPNFVTKAALARRSAIYLFLEEICVDLDLTKAQNDKAKSAYESVADWMSKSTNPFLASVDVYPQGSVALGTAVRPLGSDEFDVDLINLIHRCHPYMLPEEAKKLVGDRLAEHQFYAKILEEKKRCWRLNYAGDFHLDISPTIQNPKCKAEGELVPDRKLHSWHPTNPKGYRKLFASRALLTPKIRGGVLNIDKRALASVEPFPDPSLTKGVLRRTVQLLKRHRDNHFLHVKEEIAPISVIITTLAMQAYAYCVRNHSFDDELEILVETIRMMPHFIEKFWANNQQNYAVWNETTEGENFADRWNMEPKRITAFFSWHAKALSDFEAIRDAVGLDTVIKSTRDQLGGRVVDRVVSKRHEGVAAARTTKSLYVAPAVGIITSARASATPVPRNDFFGD